MSLLVVSHIPRIFLEGNLSISNLLYSSSARDLTLLFTLKSLNKKNAFNLHLFFLESHSNLAASGMWSVCMWCTAHPLQWRVAYHKVIQMIDYCLFVQARVYHAKERFDTFEDLCAMTVANEWEHYRKAQVRQRQDRKNTIKTREGEFTGWNWRSRLARLFKGSARCRVKMVAGTNSRNSIQSSDGLNGLVEKKMAGSSKKMAWEKMSSKWTIIL